MRCLPTGHKGRILVRAPRKSKALLEKNLGQEGGGDLLISALGMPAASDHGTRVLSAGQARYTLDFITLGVIEAPSITSQHLSDPRISLPC